MRLGENDRQGVTAAIKGVTGFGQILKPDCLNGLAHQRRCGAGLAHQSVAALAVLQQDAQVCA